MPGKRYSRQRELIYQCLKGTTEHPSAEMVYNWLKPENPGLSLGTVYRNLNLLCDEGYLIRLPFAIDRFDADVSAHAHLNCAVCGRVFDLKGPCDQIRAAFLETNPGFKLGTCRLVFDGTCAECEEKGALPLA